MAYQLLQGIQITPKGNYNLGRFSKSLVGNSWPTSFAFGGWIYNASCEIGFTEQPTEIKINIVLEVIDKAQKYAFFDIKDDDLKCDAGTSRDENLYDIDFNGVTFTDFILFEKEIVIENNTKILTVTFKDYSVILDKIYIGLIKRQGNLYVHSANTAISFPTWCPDCELKGDTLKFTGTAYRDIAYGSYVGINGKTYDNFDNISVVGNIYSQWEALFTLSPMNLGFDLNGGYLMIGTEEATEERCGDLAPMSYNFNQLLHSLRLRGLKFEGAFPRAIKDADYIYHQNYIGSLREVLQQWCSDLGYTYYTKGKTFIGVNLNRAINIQQITSITDPTTTLGADFALNQNSAILSFKEGASLNNTFKQAVLTTSNRARQVKIHSKTPKRYIGFTALHPIDFNRHSAAPVVRSDAYGIDFLDVAWANNFAPESQDRLKVLPELDGRSFGDIDTSIALLHYDDALRDIFCQDRAIYGNTAEERAANFRALGMVPLVELTDEESPEAKAIVIEKLMGGEGDEVSNICLDKRFYKVYLGYYYQKFKEDVVQWEQFAGEAMYKYGIITKGLLDQFPYFPQNSLKDLSPTSGFYGESGTALLRTSHTTQPASQQYYVMREAPFKDLILYSGLLTPTDLRMPLYNDWQMTGVFPTGLFYGELSNDWGITQEQFKRDVTLKLSDPCVEQFASSPSFTDIQNNIPKKYQDWRFELFRPVASPDLEMIYHEAAVALQNLPVATEYDRTIEEYYNLHDKLQLGCSKLHVMVLADTRNHPNIYCEFTPKGRDYINMLVLREYLDREREAVRRRAETKTLSICDISLLQEMCRDVLSGQFHKGPTGDPRFACIMDEDKVNYFTEGYPFQYLVTPNSRGLHLKIIKNPIRNDATDQLGLTLQNADVNGDFYYSDVVNEFLKYQTAFFDYTLVYPVDSDFVGGYRGILSSDVELEMRTPEICEIYGEPVNATNNTTTSLKIINNTVDPDLQPQLDPFSMRFFSYMTVITGEAQIITTVSQYHEFIKKLNNYELTTPTKTVEMSLAGTPNDFGSFKTYLSPDFGLNKLSMTVGDNGVTTSLSFADRPKQLPKQESILNKITPRIK